MSEKVTLLHLKINQNRYPDLKYKHHHKQTKQAEQGALIQGSDLTGCQGWCPLDFYKPASFQTQLLALLLKG